MGTVSTDRPLAVLFDVGHPAHVHLFRNAIEELRRRGHRTFVASREKDVTTHLLDAYGIAYRSLSRMGDGPVDLVVEWTGRELRMLSLARSFDPDVLVSVLSPPAVHVSKLLGRRSVVFTDSEASHLSERITIPFADVVCTPSGFGRDLGFHHRRYDGYHELAYLHPARFEPDPAVLRRHGVSPNSSYAVLRFISWGALHDVGQSGFSHAAKRRLIDRLERHGEVYITSESPLPPAFEPYRLPVPPEAVHHLLAYADLYVGDSQTMATEAALLGTPAVRSNSFAGEDDMSNFRELEEEYGLLRSVADETGAVQVATELMADADAKTRWHRRRNRLLEEKIDVTAYIVDVIELEGRRHRR